MDMDAAAEDAQRQQAEQTATNTHSDPRQTDPGHHSRQPPLTDLGGRDQPPADTARDSRARGTPHAHTPQDGHPREAADGLRPADTAPRPIASPLLTASQQRRLTNFRSTQHQSQQESPRQQSARARTPGRGGGKGAKGRGTGSPSPSRDQRRSPANTTQAAPGFQQAPTASQAQGSQDLPSYAAPNMAGQYPTPQEHESALAAAERAGFVAIRVVKAPYPNWQQLFEHLIQQGDAEGQLWALDRALNDSLRVVGPARNGQSCWFSLFLPQDVYSTLGFIDGVYDLSKVAGGDRPELSECLATMDVIFMRRGFDHGAVVEVTENLRDNANGYMSIEHTSQVEMWRLTNRLSLHAERFYGVHGGTRIAIRPRYRPGSKCLIHTMMVATKAHSMGMEWRLLQLARDMNGQPTDMLLEGRRFRMTDFKQAEAAHAPLNLQRMEAMQASDLASQGMRCTIDNLPSTCTEDRLLQMLDARGLRLSAKPVIIDSKFRTGTRVAFVVFESEGMALDAIMEATFMTMSGVHPQIKPSQPKKNRSLSRIEADERSRMEKNGPTDGMTPQQMADVVKMVDTSSGPHLEFLREQFKIDSEGSFANDLMNAFSNEFRALGEALRSGQEAVTARLDDIDQSLVATDTVNREFQEAIADSVTDMAGVQSSAMETIGSALHAIGSQLAGMNLSRDNQLDELSTKMDALNDAVRFMADRSAPTLSPSPAPWANQGRPQPAAPADYAEGSDDTSSEDDAVIQTFPTPESLADPLLDDLVLFDGVTVGLCREAIAEWNASAPESQRLMMGPTVEDLQHYGKVAASRNQAKQEERDRCIPPHDDLPPAPPKSPLKLGDPSTPVAASPSRTDPFPNLDKVIHRGWGRDIRDMLQAQGPAQPPDMTEGDAALLIRELISRDPANEEYAQLNEGLRNSLLARGRSARDLLLAIDASVSPSTMLPSEQMGVASPEQPMNNKRQASAPGTPVASQRTPIEGGSSPVVQPARQRHRPEVTDRDAREFIFRLTNMHPDNPAYMSLTTGPESSLTARGARARDILESAEPTQSPLSLDPDWAPRNRNPHLQALRESGHTSLQNARTDRDQRQ